ncbi:MAG: pyridoxamine 5'-phosphate oxidase family protein [Pseudomonadota bacterium]
MALYNSDQLDIVSEKIRNVQFGMFTTMDDMRILTSRPMTKQQIDGDGNLWFFTTDEAPFVRDLLNNPSVNVSFSEMDNGLYVSLSGRAELLRDRGKAQQLWNPMLKPWFPGGLDDPHLALIRVTIESAEYWDAHRGKMMQLLELAKAAISGERPKDLAEHGTIRL